MSSRLIRCPHCGEEEELRGTPAGAEGVRVECLTCGAQWLRDQTPRCATCGGDDVVIRPRGLTSHGRATVQSIVGFQEIPMCAVCDADELGVSLKHGRAVAAGYLPAALHPRPAS